MNQSGDIILTRNTDEVGNDSPGYWNHAAISAGAYIIEAQAEPDKVIAVEMSVFRLRYPEFMVFRYKDMNVAYEAALAANKLLNKPYRKLASVFMRWRRKDLGENCVSVVRKSWSKALKQDMGWRRPDHVLTTVNIQEPPGFRIIEHHKDYENWLPQPTLGRIN